MKQFLWALLVGLLTLGLIAATGVLQTTQSPKLPGLLEASAQNTDSIGPDDVRTLQVNVSSTVSAEPTKAEIWFSIETLAPTAQASQQQNAANATKVMNALKEMGITGKNIQTTSYSLYERMEWDSKRQESVSKGYQTVNALKVTVTDLTKTGQVIDKVADAGATNVSNVNFTVDEAKITELKRNALTLAAQEATAKANAIATGLGVRLNGVQSVSENGIQYIPYYKNVVMRDSASGMSPAPETPLAPGDVQVNADLTVTFRLQ